MSPPSLTSTTQRGLEALRVAWASRSVRRGFVGTVLITAGSLTPAYLPQVSPIWPVLRWAHLTGPISKWVGTGLVVAGLMVLIMAWLKLRPRAYSDHTEVAYHGMRHWAVLAIWSLPFLFAPPIFSHDAYSYAAQGWLIHNGLNPYEVGPGVLPGAFADQVAWVWRYTPAPYGPLALQLSHGIVDLLGNDPYLSAVAMRLPALVGVALIGFLLPRIASMRGLDPAMAAWFGTLNPVLVIDFVGGAHNDALMMGLVVAALWTTVRFKHLPAGDSGRAVKARPWVSMLAGAVIVGVAASIKQPALLAAVALPFLVEGWTSWRVRPLLRAALRVLVSLGLSVGVFALLSVVTGLGFGWINAVNVPGSVFTISPTTLLGNALQFPLDLVWPGNTVNLVRWARTAGFVLSGLIICYLAVMKLGRRPVYFLAWSWLWFALLAPAIHSWYVLWGGLLLPLAKPSERTYRAAVFGTLVLLCFGAINFSVRNGAVAVGIALVGGAWWVLRTHESAHKERSGGLSS